MADLAYDIVFLMDPYETLNLRTETSLLCIDALMRRNHRIYWLEERDLYLELSVPRGRVRPILSVDPFVLGEWQHADISRFDAVCIRKDPPFGANYLYITYILDFLPPRVVQFNSPKALRELNEKLYTLQWPNFCPDSVTSLNTEIIMEFAKKHDRIVLKPLDDCSGRGIQFVKAGQPDLRERIEAQMGTPPRYIMAQEYLPEVREGDRRIFMLDGEPLGWVNRIPQPGSDLANIHTGASVHRFEMSQREKDIVAMVGPQLRQRYIPLAGVDIIGGRLTEINITSPSALRQINQVTGTHLEERIVDGMIAKLDLVNGIERGMLEAVV